MPKTKLVRAIRRAAAEARNAAYASIPDAQRLARPTCGAKERRKILNRIGRKDSVG